MEPILQTGQKGVFLDPRSLIELINGYIHHVVLVVVVVVVAAAGSRVVVVIVGRTIMVMVVIHSHALEEGGRITTVGMHQGGTIVRGEMELHQHGRQFFRGLARGQMTGKATLGAPEAGFVHVDKGNVAKEGQFVHRCLIVREQDQDGVVVIVVVVETTSVWLSLLLLMMSEGRLDIGLQGKVHALVSFAPLQ